MGIHVFLTMRKSEQSSSCISDIVCLIIFKLRIFVAVVLLLSASFRMQSIAVICYIFLPGASLAVCILACCICVLHFRDS